MISWAYGDDLGECTTLPEVFMLAMEAEVIGYEVVLEPEDDESFKFTVRSPTTSTA